MRILRVIATARLRSIRPLTCALASLSLLAGCAVDQPTSVAIPSRASLGKTPSGPTVTSTNPSYAHRGDTQLSVHVFGSGFADGAKAQWSLGADTTSVTTTSTTLVSSSELIAVITVSGTAPLALYDVSVTNLGGKKGVGAELFAVTTATVVGSGTLGGDAIINEINDLGQIVGYFVQAGPFVTRGDTIVSLGTTGQAWGISPSGDVVVGRDDAPVAWVRQPSGAYVKETLPAAVLVGGGAMHAAADPNGTLIVGGYQRTSASKQSQSTQPVVWTRTGSTWAGPTGYSQPADQGTGWGVTGSGKMMGRVLISGTTFAWGVWDSPSTFTALTAPYLQAMNQAATIVVGVLPAGGPGFWYRDSTAKWNPTGVALPTGSTACDGSAQDVNDAGVIVGYACDKAVVWRVDVSGSSPVIKSGPQYLVGLGGNGTNAGSRADAVNSTSPYVVAGGALSGGRRLLVKWLVP